MSGRALLPAGLPWCVLWVGLAACAGPQNEASRPSQPPATVNAAQDRAPTVKLTVSEPQVLARAPVGEENWGRWQFPVIRRLADGRLHVSFSTGADSMDSSQHSAGSLCSPDNGTTWEPVTRDIFDTGQEFLVLPNGDGLRAVCAGAVKVPSGDRDLPKPACSFVDSWGYPCSLYRQQDLPERLGQCPLLRMTAATHRWIGESAKVQIPGELKCVVNEAKQEKGAAKPVMRPLVEPVTEGFMWLTFLDGRQMGLAPDGSLWAVTPARRLPDGAVDGIPRVRVCFLRSEDAGHTWHLWGEIPYRGNAQADPQAEEREGFTEPFCHLMPDGSSFLCLMRTSDGNGNGPLYLARSADGGKTWSEPEVFGSYGKVPQLLTMANGVTLACYGQSGASGDFTLRATADPSGQNWDPPVRTRVSPAGGDTCGHVEMVALDADTALLVHSAFKYPDEEGNLRKTILLRRVQVSPRSN
jgi:hypothetical protein